MKTIKISAILLAVALVLIGCTASPTPAQPTAVAGLPNLASVHCEEQGGQLEIITGEDGGQYGMCLFPDGSQCEEWAYFRSECGPGDSQAATTPDQGQVTAPAPTSASEEVSQGWKIYRDEELGYSFQYPAGAEIVQDENSLGSISIIGPLVDNEHWPDITISHPGDREDYRPPEDADLLGWRPFHRPL